MSTLNLGIVAHVDAGKTTLTERLLYETGVISTIGRVDHGDTTTDSDALERRRGITIRSGVVAFRIGELKVNLIDTPGHSDFVAEVERALAILDGAVLVVSAVEGVQAQTRVLIRLLERLQIPFLVFVNKIDRLGARRRETVSSLSAALHGDPVPMNVARRLGSRAAVVETPDWQRLQPRLLELIAEHDDALADAYLDGSLSLPKAEVLDRMRDVVASCAGHPLYFGAALHGIGVRSLMEAIAQFLPPGSARLDAPLHGQVFKIEKRPGAPKLAYVRLRSGVLAPRAKVEYYRRGRDGDPVAREGRTSAVRVLSHGTGSAEAAAPAGEIATVVGLSEVQIGDQLGRWDPSLAGRLFAEPGLEAVVRPVDPARRPDLFEALRILSEQDPLIAARLDGIDEDITVSLYGEVQKEVLASRLREEFGIATSFLATRTIHVERVAGVGESVATVATGNATVGLRVEPAPVDSGLRYRLTIERGWLLPSHHKAIEETLAKERGHGLSGWRVADCSVALIAGRFSAPTPPAGYFRTLTAQTFRAALQAAGTVVCAPMTRFELDFPSPMASAMLRELAAVAATPYESTIGPARGRIVGVMPTAAVHDVEQRLPHLTQGLGALITEPAGFQPVPTLSGAAERGSRRCSTASPAPMPRQR